MAIIDRLKLNKSSKAQTMVEFALIMPILLLVIFGLLEVGRLIFMNTMVISAAREGARYGSATGIIPGVNQYKDCTGIRAAAKKVDVIGVISDANIEIKYDEGPTDGRSWASLPSCPPPASFKLDGTQRILVKVSAPWQLAAGLVPLPSRTLTSINERTLLGTVKLPTPPPPAPNVFTLFVKIVGTGNVTSDPAGINCSSGTCHADYDKDQAVELTANWDPSIDTFEGWSGGGCSGINPKCTVTLSASKTVTATFSGPKVPLTVTKIGTGTGTVANSPAGTACGAGCQEYTVGTTVVLTATEPIGSAFEGWGGDASGCPADIYTCTVDMTAAKNVTATFTAMPPQTLTVTKSGAGTGTVTSTPAGINCGSTCSADFPYGTSITLKATVVSPNQLMAWSGACGGSGKVDCLVSMKGAKTVDAKFEPVVCSITSSGNLNNLTNAGNGNGLSSWSITNNTLTVVTISQIYITYAGDDLLTIALPPGYSTVSPHPESPVDLSNANGLLPAGTLLPSGTSILQMKFKHINKAPPIHVTMHFSDDTCSSFTLTSP